MLKDTGTGLLVVVPVLTAIILVPDLILVFLVLAVAYLVGMAINDV